ncbi:MAG: magnesium transporter CorA family protein [Actinomycetota bacterium]|nr:magnesium transporter CorA family protein [Actinomycetota bacterium]
MGETPRWVDLLDPDRVQLEEALSRKLDDRDTERILDPHDRDSGPRPTLESHDDYVFGIFMVAVDHPHADRIYYQEVDLVVSPDTVLTVRKTPPDGEPFDPEELREACAKPIPAGMIAYHLVNAIAERYLDLIDNLNDDIDGLEERVDELPPAKVRERLSHLRHDMLRIRRTLAPTRDAVRRVIDDRIELESYELFPPEIDRRFSDAYDKLLRAAEGLDLSRDLLAGVRDYSQSKISIDQNERVKQLSAIASMVLIPTFIVGVYGQNFDHMPELHWRLGYLFSWTVIVVSTLAQFVYFRRKRWI